MCSPNGGLNTLSRLTRFIVYLIDGYEFENGNLRYWRKDAVESSRRIVEATASVR